MVFLFNTIAAVLLLWGSSASGQTYSLNIRDNGKICTQWVPPVNGQFSISYTQQAECTTNPAFEQANGQARLCCQGMALTTPSSTFPKECGKQQYEPLRTRIIGGLTAQANSWVSIRSTASSLYFHRHNLTVFFFSVLAMANPVTWRWQHVWWRSD
jgi:hypothetical protein